MTETLRKNQIKSLFMGQTEDNFWFPVAKMTWDYEEGEYRNCKVFYLKGAAELEQLYPKNPYIVSLGSLERVFTSKDIKTCFWHKRLPVNRPVANPKMFEKLGLSGNPPYDPVEYIARSGGYWKGDSNDLFPEVLPDKEGNYNFYFRPVDCWSFSTPNRPELENIAVGEIVKPLFFGEKIKLECQKKIIGTVPGYIRYLIDKYKEALKLTVAVVNDSLPYEHQTLVRACLSRDVGVPFIEEIFQPVNSE